MSNGALLWKIIGYGLTDLYIMADSFDEALARAMTINSRYCGGYVYKD